jgi:colanic acid/amylovoran biosynthesis glycosyltransferase
MKIGYVCSLYPAVSHTFIQREIAAVRARGVDVATFSIRRPRAADILGPEAHREAVATRSVLPFAWTALLRSWTWIWFTRPRRALRVLVHALRRPVRGPREFFCWLGYYLEAAVLARWLVTEKFDHLHCHFGNSGAVPAMLAAELADISFSITCHGSELLEPRQHRLAEKVARAAFVACVSKYGKAQLMLHCPSHHWSKLHVVHCGLPSVEAGHESANA